MTTPSTIRLYGTAPDSIVDGPGLRFAVFVQGCTHACPGCHNPDSQPACGGVVRRIDELANEIAANGLVQGVTISGGEPFEQAAECAELALRVRERGLNVWTYSGYRYEDIAALAAATPATAAATPAGDIAPTSDTTPATRATPATATAATPNTRPSQLLPSVDPVGAAALLNQTDVLVDGPFVQALHSFDLPWRGSSNQRLIDVPATRASGRIVLWETRQEFPKKPSSW